ncbi:MAG: glycoside hydrolase family 97 catalytic domain-containing protein [Bacteroidales bacterium]|nr:glycoside hydrolase family 97 catalytic domain-containing protein [Bacteroidales bacterium]
MRGKICPALFAAILFSTVLTAQNNVRVTSPDGSHTMEIHQSTRDGKFHLEYEVTYRGRHVILPSELFLDIDNTVWENAIGKRFERPETWMESFEWDSMDTFSRDTTWHNAFGERSTVSDSFNGAVIHLTRNDKCLYRLDLELRAYNEGVAFRYRLPMHPDALYHRIKADNTEFSFPEGTLALHAPWAQGFYEFRPLEGWTDEAERPMTLKIEDDLWAAVGEAGVIDFPRGKLRLSKDKPSTLVAALNDNATDIVTPYDMPWRVVMAADKAGTLMEHNDIFLNLNEASAIADESWIKPGKILRETTLTTENSIACIDFCARHNMDYILYDWKWYGPAYDFNTDATKVVAPIDMPKVIEYGRSKGVGVWVYVNQHALQKQAEDLFPVLAEWGIAGIKFGFVHFTSQHWSEWLHRLVRLAAKNGLMVNIHDEYRPTGYSRTYPNLLTQEGICGNEEFPKASHNTILPFTRMLCGAADYTVCYFDPRLKHTTHAHQLALPVIFFSPLQTLYWYDSPKRIVEVPELEFFDNVPVVWDDTKVLCDKIGECVAIARRSEEKWWVGMIGGDEEGTHEISLDMLEAGRFYAVKVYYDSPSVNTVTHVGVAEYAVTGGQMLKFHLHCGGGAAMEIRPIDARQARKMARLTPKTVL